MKKISIYLFIILLIFHELSILAEEDKNKFQYFSGKIQTGCIWILTNDQLHVDEKNKKASSLSKNSNFFQTIDPGFLLDLNYSLPSGMRFYFGNPEEDAGKAIKLGCFQDFKNNSVIGVSAKYKFDESAWKNPFITDQEREYTDVDIYVFDISMDRIAGSNLKIDYSFETVNVDHDILGDLYNNELKRDGFIHSLSMGYTFKSGANNIIVPGLQYTITDFDGKSNNFSGYSGGIDYIKLMKNIVCMLSISVSNDKHQKTHPEPKFNKKRNDVTIETLAIVTWMNPMDYNDYFINLGGIFIKNESNINFFDKITYLGIISLGYNF
ncbi:MAG: DUF2860 family protein [bacterium]